MNCGTTGLVEGAACMCEGLWGKPQLFEGLCIHAKKEKEQKNIFKRIKKMLMIFKLKKKNVGDLFILGLVLQKKSPQMIY